jgi:ribosomal protein L29
MTMTELQKKTDGDLVHFINEKREELRKLRFGVTGSGMRNTRSIRSLRHEIAQALTEIRIREQKA